MRHRFWASIVLTLVASTAHVAAAPASTDAAGEPGDPRKPARLVLVTMKDGTDGTMQYIPGALDVKAGEQVRFRVTNTGTLDHEFMLGTTAQNSAHKMAMSKHPGMMHAEANGVSVAPGRSADLVWRFTKAGTIEVACLIPGHYEAGMHAAVSVR